MKVDFSKRKDLLIYQILRHSEKWGRFVLNNRLHKEILDEYNITEHNQDSKYDICVGENADGSIINEAYLVNSRTKRPEDVSFEKFLKTIGSDYPQQYSFHTKRALITKKK